MVPQGPQNQLEDVLRGHGGRGEALDRGQLPRGQLCLDYGIWGFIESKACDRPHNSVADLRASVDREWAAMPEAYVVQTCKAFRRHLEAMLAANGGHFKK